MSLSEPIVVRPHINRGGQPRFAAVTVRLAYGVGHSQRLVVGRGVHPDAARWVAAIQRGLQESLSEDLAELIGPVTVILEEIHEHPVDSTEGAFEQIGRLVGGAVLEHVESCAPISPPCAASTLAPGSGFGSNPRFEWLGGGRVVGRSGTQTNCGGIGEVTVDIHPCDGSGLTFPLSGEPGDFDKVVESHGRLSGKDLPHDLQRATLRGAEKSMGEFDLPFGLRLELIEALVHPVDATQRRFESAGANAMRGWLETMGVVRIAGHADDPWS